MFKKLEARLQVGSDQIRGEEGVRILDLLANFELVSS
jgi:hypothetical protein